MRKYTCHIMTWSNDHAKLAFSSTRPSDFITRAGKAALKVAEEKKKSGEKIRGVFLDIQIGQETIPMGWFVLDSAGHFYPYIGQGRFSWRSMGVKRFQGFVRGAILRYRELERERGDNR